jgi:DNA-binding transcriptional regulator YiaG
LSIKEAREKAGLSRRQLSEWLGIPQRTQEDWDYGKRTPPEWVERLIIEKIESLEQE